MVLIIVGHLAGLKILGSYFLLSLSFKKMLVRCCLTCVDFEEFGGSVIDLFAQGPCGFYLYF